MKTAVCFWNVPLLISLSPQAEPRLNASFKLGSSSNTRKQTCLPMLARNGSSCRQVSLLDKSSLSRVEYRSRCLVYTALVLLPRSIVHELCILLLRCNRRRTTHFTTTAIVHRHTANHKQCTNNRTQSTLLLLIVSCIKSYTSFPAALAWLKAVQLAVNTLAISSAGAPWMHECHFIHAKLFHIH